MLTFNLTVNGIIGVGLSLTSYWAEHILQDLKPILARAMNLIRVGNLMHRQLQWRCGFLGFIIDFILIHVWYGMAIVLTLLAFS